MTYESIILVDENDQMFGTMEKMAAHRLGKLHRAFSVFIFNSNGQVLLQRRAFHKYHSGGKWSNTCCSHPRPGEALKQAANRRLLEEMGLTCELSHAFNFIYHADVGDGIYEHELDHIFIGTTDTLPKLNPNEVAAFAYVSLENILYELKHSPEKYTEWFKVCFARVIKHYTLFY